MPETKRFRQQSDRLANRHFKFWTFEEKRVLKGASKLGRLVEAIQVVLLARTYSAILQKLKDMRLPKPIPHGNRWHDINGDAPYIVDLHKQGKSIEKIQAKVPWHTLKHIDKVVRRHVLRVCSRARKTDRSCTEEEDGIIKAALAEGQQKPLTHQELIKELILRMSATSSLDLEDRVTVLRQEIAEASNAQQRRGESTDEEEQRLRALMADGRTQREIAEALCRSIGAIIGRLDLMKEREATHPSL